MSCPDFQKIKENLQCFSRPIYETVITTLVGMIEAGELAPGTKFPPDKKLAIELGISHVTLARALNELRRRNILERRRASGTFVPENRDPQTPLQARKKIAVVFDYASEKTFQQQLFLQLHHGLEELNCTMLFFSSDSDPDRQLRQLREILNDFSISGCIVWSILSTEQAAEIVRLRPRYYPLIFLDKHYPELEHDAVTYNNFDCGVAVAKALQRKKVQQIFWVEDLSAHNTPTVIDRRNGVLSVLPDPALLPVIELSGHGDDFAMEFAPESAMICGDFESAVHLKEFARRRGITLPERLITFETVTDDHTKIPEFTAYRFPCELGNETINILSSRLNGKEACTVNHSGKWSVLGAKSTMLKQEKEE